MPDIYDCIIIGGGHTRVDTVYPALGSRPSIELLEALGIPVDEHICVPADQHQAIGLQGLYAAGDLVAGLNQISDAMGHATIAATDMHNYLRERDNEKEDS